MSDSYSALIEHFLASHKAEARGWLGGGSKDCGRSLGEMDVEESKAFVERLYGLGAEEVLAVEIEEDEDWANTKHVLVRLPADESVRGRIFAFEREHAEVRGFEGTADEGQEYLYFNAK